MTAHVDGVLVVDDHAVFAEALSSAFGAAPDFHDVRWSCVAAEAIEVAREHRPALAVVDMRMPDVEGNELVEGLTELDPAPVVLVLSVAADARTILGAFEAGASGFLGTHESFEAVIRACRSVLADENPISASAFSRILPRLLKSGSDLTDQEDRVLGSMAAGRSNDEIGIELGISPNTARNHVSSVLRKLESDSRAAAVDVARRQGLIPDR
ncbi:response regulator [Ilumatobacter sp.]|uniref:response regulator transcription factor n=1 Tax=Ilumatobacter sp. TaxID=1967498 RepID=UPI003B526388